ncbi:MAG: hypothetical protein EAY81_07580 [Bacteroidetes bacterium]|nr:MAG: hypothetical protein EAY81_07580 [Bacteroidota bacterium]
MKKLTQHTVLLLAFGSLLLACKDEETKKEDPKPNTPIVTPATMASLKGNWKSSGTNQAQGDQSGYSESILSVNEDSTCSWTKVSKSGSGSNLVMTGRLTLTPSNFKDSAGYPIDYIAFTFDKINGQSFSGTTFGIYQAKETSLKLDWLFYRSGVTTAEPDKGWGSSSEGLSALSTYTKQ